MGQRLKSSQLNKVRNTLTNVTADMHRHGLVVQQ